MNEEIEAVRKSIFGDRCGLCNPANRLATTEWAGVSICSNCEAEMLHENASPRPWSIRDEGEGRSVAVIDARGGVVALMKAGGGRKRPNAEAIVRMVNRAMPQRMEHQPDADTTH